MGMARAHRRGNVTERALCGAITTAQTRGLDGAGVRAILTRYALRWDEAANRVVVADSPRVEDDQSSPSVTERARRG
jgi:hypothetical protein